MVDDTLVMLSVSVCISTRGCLYIWVLLLCVSFHLTPPSESSLWGYNAALMVWFTNLQRPALLWNQQPRTCTVSSGQHGDWLTVLIDRPVSVCVEACVCMCVCMHMRVCVCMHMRVCVCKREKRDVEVLHGAYLIRSPHFQSKAMP